MVKLTTDHLKISDKSGIYNEIHEICGFTQGFNRKSIIYPQKVADFNFYRKRWRYCLDVIRNWNWTASESIGMKQILAPFSSTIKHTKWANVEF